MAAPRNAEPVYERNATQGEGAYLFRAGVDSPKLTMGLADRAGSEFIAKVGDEPHSDLAPLQ